MTFLCFKHRIAVGLAVVLSVMLPALRPQTVQAQSTTEPAPGSARDSVVVQAGSIYAAGSLHRYFLGDNYRELWAAPIKVPVLDLRSFAGGLTPFKLGGGRQAKSLRFVAPDSSEYVFRQVRKTMTILSEQFDGTVIESIFRDQGSASYPAAAVVAVPMLGAVRVLHPTPRIVVMPDDPLLGEFREEFGGVLGMIEEYPSVPKKGPAFADADEIIDSDELLEKINKEPQHQIDARALLTARLMDMLLGDNDRHPGQWKWARLKKDSDAPWVPIPRDRDKVFVSYEGMLLSLARFAIPSLVKFDARYPNPVALFANATEFDRRLLGGLDKSVWDSVATYLSRSVTDAVIDRGMRAAPPEYVALSHETVDKLKARRDNLSAAAARYYRELSTVADIHGSDADDRATVVRSADGSVEVRIQSGKAGSWFSRRFDPGETREIRVYLHGGDDSAVVTGSAPRSIPLRIIGGNGKNALVDLSTVGGDRNPTHLYDVGFVKDVKYARDSVDEKKNADDALNHYFNRRPWVRAYGTLIPPTRDRGSSIGPIAGLRTGRGLGVVARLGAARYVYGFRTVPYSTMLKGEVAYATKNRFEVALAGDQRFESSAFHLPAEARASQLDVVQFHGFGNDVPDLRGDFYDVKQTQWQFHPALGLSINPESEISLGPVVRYTVTDSARNRFISEQQPYGFAHFGQAGVQLKLRYDTRVVPDTLKPRAVVDIIGTAYPAMWDVESAYETVSAVGSAYFTLRLPKRPVIALRAGGKKLFGDFPYFDAAFLGGSSSLRTEDRQRFAGDASLYGTAELRVPVAQFPLILPLDVGLLGFTDAGRVYVDGESPGGWHTAAGAGFWVGMVNPGTGINILFTNQRERRTLVNIGFAF